MSRRLNNLLGRRKVRRSGTNGSVRMLEGPQLARWFAGLAALRGESPPPPYADSVRLLRASLTKLSDSHPNVKG